MEYGKISPLSEIGNNLNPKLSPDGVGHEVPTSDFFHGSGTQSLRTSARRGATSQFLSARAPASPCNCVVLLSPNSSRICDKTFSPFKTYYIEFQTSLCNVFDKKEH